MQLDLGFSSQPDPAANLGEGTAILRGFALPQAATLLGEVTRMTAEAPFRHLMTPGGHRMSVGMSNCGALGWVSDERGYRYTPRDPLTDRAWPAMPESFVTLARTAAEAAGFVGYAPEACLINRYEPGARLTLHQDRNEHALLEPIVSVSLGLPATFLFGGLERTDKTQRVALLHGDVVVWGGPARMAFHGVLPLKDGTHPATGSCRINLTFRRVLKTTGE